MNPRIALVTPVPSPHQMPLSKALFDIIGQRFTAVFTKPLGDERKALGWRDPDEEYPWVLSAWKSTTAQERLRELLLSSDAVVCGFDPADLIRQRIRAGRLTFRYMERPFKRGFLLGFPWWFNRLGRDFWPLDLANHHLLATGAYCSRDFTRVRMFSQRQWKWGYFAHVADTPPPARPDLPVNLLWAGRMLDLKRVDLLLQAARCLYLSGKRFSLTLIGDGPERSRLLRYSQRNKMQGYVTFHPPVLIGKVQEYMSSSHIYVLTSSYLEGWGVVINEAMASGCCVVSSTGPGAAPWLIEPGRTGYLFRSGNLNELCSVLSPLIDNLSHCREVGRNAWEKMRTLWSPEVAAERLIRLISGLLGSEPVPDYSDGPCSRA